MLLQNGLAAYPQGAYVIIYQSTLAHEFSLLKLRLNIHPGSCLLTRTDERSSGLAISEVLLRRIDIWFEQEEDAAAFEAGSVRVSASPRPDRRDYKLMSYAHPSYEVFRHVFETPELSALYNRFQQ